MTSEALFSAPVWLGRAKTNAGVSDDQPNDPTYETPDAEPYQFVEEITARTP